MEKNHYIFSIGNKGINVNEQLKQKYRSGLNLPYNKKIILVTVALWQQVPSKYTDAANFYNINIHDKNSIIRYPLCHYDEFKV